MVFMLRRQLLCVRLRPIHCEALLGPMQCCAVRLHRRNLGIHKNSFGNTQPLEGPPTFTNHCPHSRPYTAPSVGKCTPSYFMIVCLMMCSADNVDARMCYQCYGTSESCLTANGNFASGLYTVNCSTPCQTSVLLQGL
jgi:hypothetical protein